MSSHPSSQRPSSSAGFTLIELMIVVAVIGILAAIALPMYGDTSRAARSSTRTTKLGDFRTQMEKYFMDNRTYLERRRPAASPQSGGRRQRQFHDYLRTRSPDRRRPTRSRRRASPRRAWRGFVYTVDQTNAKTSAGPAGKYTNPALLGRTQGRVLLMIARAHRGFTLIELMIGLAIAGAAAGARDAELFGLDRRRRRSAMPPSRSPADCAMRRARRSRATAPSRSSSIRPAGPGGLDARSTSMRRYCRRRVFAEGAALATSTPMPAAATTVTFSALGGIVANARRERDADRGGYHVRDGGGRRAQSQRAGRRRSVPDRNRGIKICDPEMAGDRSEGLPALTIQTDDPTKYRPCTP